MPLPHSYEFAGIRVDSLETGTRDLPRASIGLGLGNALGRTATAHLLQLTIQQAGSHQVLRLHLLLYDLFPLVQFRIGPIQRTLRA